MRTNRFLPPAGFTLIEVLVAVFVFSLLAATAYAGLNAMAGAVEAQRARAAELADLQRAVATLDGDLRQLVSRPGRDREGRARPALEGGPGVLVGRRAGRLNPAGLPRSHLQQFRWRHDGTLLREAWGAVDTPPEADPVARTRFEWPAGLEFRYRDADGAWHRQWPVSGRLDALPSAIEYVLDTPAWGPVRRVVAL
ncbi:MAG: type II secretion system minor pseudopilin GspJ [Candidatus Wenzhouxiangella sp. M2_3B_020]